MESKCQGAQEKIQFLPLYQERYLKTHINKHTVYSRVYTGSLIIAVHICHKPCSRIALQPGSLREASTIPMLLCTLSDGYYGRILPSPFHPKESIVKPTPVHLPLTCAASSKDSGERMHSQGLEVGTGTSTGRSLIEARPPGFRFAHAEC